MRPRARDHSRLRTPRLRSTVPAPRGARLPDRSLCRMQRAPRARHDSTGAVWYDWIGSCVGTWRSLVAHSAGGRVVAGSNPAVPTPRGGISLTERPGSFGHTPTRVERHRVLRPDSGHLLRRVRPARLPVEPRRGRLRREAPPAIEV